MIENKLYKVSEIAEIYGVTRAGVYYWINEKKLHTQEVREVGKKPYRVISRHDVDRLLNIGVK